MCSLIFLHCLFFFFFFQLFISQSFPCLGIFTFTSSIPSVPQCQVQRQELPSTLVPNLFLKLTPATHNIGTNKTRINLISNILQLPHMSTDSS